MEQIEMSKMIMWYLFWIIMIWWICWLFYYIITKSFKFGKKVNKAVNNIVDKNAKEYDEKK